MPGDPAPRATSALRHRDFALLWTRQANMNVAPARRRGQVFRSFHSQHARYVHDVHAAEKRYAVVHHQQLPMIAAIEDAQRAKSPQSLAQRMKGVNMGA